MILNCTIKTSPFVYLGLSVGVGARKLSTWQQVIKKMRKKLTPFGGGSTYLLGEDLLGEICYFFSFSLFSFFLLKLLKRLLMFLIGFKEAFCGMLRVRNI